MSKEIAYVKPHDLIIIGLDTDDREENPLYDERVFQPVDEALVKNIMVYGIQQPVLVRREAGRYYVVDGRQRTRAARRAATVQEAAGEYQVKVPVREVRADDKRIAGIMVSTNELRQDDEVLTKATKATRLFDLVGDINEVAIAFGRTPQQIRNWFKLAEAESSIHAAIQTGVISDSAGIELARYPREEQEEALERAVKAAGGKQVSESTARKDRAEQGHSTRTSKSTPAASSGKTTNRQSRAQAGVKRTWLREALKTKAAKGLTDDQRATLTWMATGYAEEGTWISDFVEDASKEL